MEKKKNLTIKVRVNESKSQLSLLLQLERLKLDSTNYELDDPGQFI